MLATFVVSRPVHAQSAEAEALFNDGNRLMTEHKLPQACDAFEASTRVEPRAGTLIRLGDCREQNQQLASAWSAYRDALSRVKDPYKRDYATARASALEPRLSYFMISVSTDSKLDGLTITRNGKPLDPMLWNRALPVDGGDYVIVARAPGHDDWRATASVPLERGDITLEVPRLREPTVPPPPPPDLRPLVPVRVAPPSARLTLDGKPIAIDRGSIALPPGPAPGGFTLRRKLALTGVGVAAVATAVGAVLGVQAIHLDEDALALCASPSPPCHDASKADDLNLRARSRALDANIAFGIAGGAAITAAVLWLTGAPDSRVAVIPHFDAIAGLDLAVSF